MFRFLPLVTLLACAAGSNDPSADLATGADTGDTGDTSSTAATPSGPAAHALEAA